jgi:hypothetical protein
MEGNNPQVVKYLFNAPCPVLDCPNNSREKRFTWYHAKCKGEMYVTENAELVCEKGHSAPMLDWRFRCENHDYDEPNPQGLLLALTIIAQMQDVDSLWLCDVSDKLSKQTRRKLQNNEFNAKPKFFDKWKPKKREDDS